MFHPERTEFILSYIVLCLNPEETKKRETERQEFIDFESRKYFMAESVRVQEGTVCSKSSVIKNICRRRRRLSKSFVSLLSKATKVAASWC